MTKKLHKVILIPGLGDEGGKFEWAVRNWKTKYDIDPHVFVFGWKDKETGFEGRLDNLTGLIDELSSENTNLTLIGASAGASACFNAYYKRREEVGMLMNVCGRLRKCVNVTPSLDWAARNSKAFYQSVIKCEEDLSSLTSDDLKKVYTFRGLYDEIVPSSTSIVSGATNETIFSFEHMLSGILMMTLYSNKLIRIIKR